MATREEWVGRVGQEWARRSGALERLLAPAGEAGLAALDPQPGERVLDLGCGAGSSTLLLSEAVGPQGAVTGIDVSPDLLAVARERAGGRAGVSLIEADAACHDFKIAHDALFSRFGSMFFDDPAGAFVNLRRALKPEARAVFVAWRSARLNDWAAIPMSVTPGGPAAAGGGPGPFAWAEPAAWRPVLQGAGFGDLRERPHDFLAEVSDGEDPNPIARAVTFATRIGPLASRLREAPENARRSALEALAQRLAEHVVDGAVRLRASAWIIEART